ncbi:MAG: Crp/Fnr family transcriptional regulator [Spirochaetales bacterium]|nr:Crp/Fnr family transcriptional regulator [Spirochaetales bacterium]
MRLNRDVFDRHVKQFKTGTVIFQEGDRGEELYIIIEGEVEIRKSTYTSSSKTLISLGRGDMFGEMAIIEKKARSATAVATKPTKLLIMNENLFEKVIEKNSDFAKKMIRILSERLRRANTILQKMIVTTRDNQIIGGLIQFAHDYGTPTFNGFRINIDKFVNWACDRLGIRSDDILQTIQDLLRRGIVTNSALGDREIILKEKKR